MMDLVGEQHFLGTTLANQAAKARFYVGRMPEGANMIDAPEPVEDEALQGMLESIGGGPVGFGQMVQRLCVNLWVAGDGWVVGIPKILMPDYKPEEDEDLEEGEEPPALPNLEEGEALDLNQLVWRMMSISEVTLHREGIVTLHLGEEESEKVTVDPDFLYMVRVWRPHPRRWWEADSPTRSSLPVLRELVGLTMHISAQVDSRLAGAGVFIVPASAARAMKVAAGIPEDSQEDPFTDALIEAMLTPIGDRANASALVPLVITVPDEAAAHFQHITFAKPLDAEARSLRDEAIRRLALGQDAPPELLLGTGGMNHWGAWLVRDDVVTTHIEPPLALIADALTQQYLRPLMRANGYKPEDVKRHVIWYDVSDMIVRPNQAADALTLFDRNALSDEALRESMGFNEADAPETSKMSLAAQVAFDMVKVTPALMMNPGLPALVEQLGHLIAGDPVDLPEKAAKKAAAAAAQVPDTATNPQAQPRPQPQQQAPTPSQAKPNPGGPPQNPSVNQDPGAARQAATASQDVSTYRLNGVELTPRDIYEAFGRDPEGHNILALALSGETGDVVQDLAEDMRRSGADDAFTQGFLRAAEQQRLVKLNELHAEDDAERAEKQAWLDGDTLSTEDDAGDNASALGGASNGAIIVLLPSDKDAIHRKVDTGFDAHLTLAYLADDYTTIDPEDLGEVTAKVQEVARTFRGVRLDVKGVEALGDAVVAKLDGSALTELRARLLEEGSVVAKLDSDANKYADEEFQAHVSLEYDSDADEVELEQAYVTFDQIGVWLGDVHYDFPLQLSLASQLASQGGTIASTIASSINNVPNIQMNVSHTMPESEGLGFVRRAAPMRQENRP
jgi:hypothetical protein